MQENDLTQEKLKQELEYDPETGLFTWIAKRSGVVTGKKAHKLNTSGYVQIRVLGKSYVAHRLVWLYTHGEFPECQIDHINGQRADNRLVNLRLAQNNDRDNRQNSTLQSNNTTGFMGVTRMKDGKYMAQINKNGVKYYLGVYAAPEEAHAVYLKARADMFTFQPIPRE